MFKRRGRRDSTIRELAEQSKQSLDFLTALYGAPGSKPALEIEIPPKPKKRTPRASAVPALVPLESEVQAAIVEYLLHHPAVGLVERVNSGMAMETDASGKTRYIKYNKVFRKGVRKVDLDVTLKNGARRMVIEVKRPGWKGPSDAREEAQAAYIEYIVSLGGVGLFAMCVDDVAKAFADLVDA